MMKIKINKYNQALILGSVIIVVSFLALSYYQKFGKKSHEFLGVMEGFSADSITLRGAYMMPGVSLFEASKQTHRVIAVIDDETEFIKEIVTITAPKDAYGFGVKPKVGVKSKKEAGSFGEVKGIGGSPAMARFNFRIISKENIYGRNKIKADEVHYSIIEENQAK